MDLSCRCEKWPSVKSGANTYALHFSCPNVLLCSSLHPFPCYPSIAGGCLVPQHFNLRNTSITYSCIHEVCRWSQFPPLDQSRNPVELQLSSGLVLYVPSVCSSGSWFCWFGMSFATGLFNIYILRFTWTAHKHTLRGLLHIYVLPVVNWLCSSFPACIYYISGSFVLLKH